MNEPRALPLMDHVFALSQYTQMQLAANVPQSNLSLDWTVVDVDLFHPAEVPPVDGYILSVGRFGDPRKNVRPRLQACRHLRENPLDASPMMLVGEQSRYVDWKEAGSWGIAEHMDVRVNVAPGLLPSLYRQASLFVLPSDEEGGRNRNPGGDGIGPAGGQHSL